MTRARVVASLVVVVLLLAIAVVVYDRATMQRIDHVGSLAPCPQPGTPEPHELCWPWQPGDSHAPSVAR